MYVFAAASQRKSSCSGEKLIKKKRIKIKAAVPKSRESGEEGSSDRSKIEIKDPDAG